MANETEKAKILERIKKLLTLAENAGATVDEASTAAMKARALMSEYNITYEDAIREELATDEDAVVSDSSWAQASPYIQANIDRRGFKVKDIPDYSQWLAVAVSDLFDCKASQGKDLRFGACIRFFGYKQDVIVAKWTFDYLLDTVRRATTKFMSTYENEAISKKKAAASFRVGMARAIIISIAKIIEGRKAMAAGQNALVIYKQDAIEKKFGKFNYGQSKPRDYDQRAMVYGYIEGEKVNVNPNTLGSTAKASGYLRK